MQPAVRHAANAKPRTALQLHFFFEFPIAHSSLAVARRQFPLLLESHSGLERAMELALSVIGQMASGG